MKKLLLATLLISILFITACSANEKQEELMFAIKGEIVEINDGRFLVESQSEELSDGSPDAIWFTTDDIDSVSTGQIVSVWTTHIEESYPGQAEAEKIEIQE
ncbi:MAG: DUF3221 domain-containing protein [Bacillota bacterium]